MYVLHSFKIKHICDVTENLVKTRKVHHEIRLIKVSSEKPSYVTKAQYFPFSLHLSRSTPNIIANVRHA
jgi:hypothetical protein